jgi:hypothetical protein
LDPYSVLSIGAGRAATSFTITSLAERYGPENRIEKKLVYQRICPKTE